MLVRFVCAALVGIALGCASPADMAKSELGDSECAERAEEKCEENLAGSDRIACLKRETYLCEELERRRLRDVDSTGPREAALALGRRRGARSDGAATV